MRCEVAVAARGTADQAAVQPSLNIERRCTGAMEKGASRLALRVAEGWLHTIAACDCGALPGRISAWAWPLQLLVAAASKQRQATPACDSCWLSAETFWAPPPSFWPLPRGA